VSRGEIGLTIVRAALTWLDAHACCVSRFDSGSSVGGDKAFSGEDPLFGHISLFRRRSQSALSDGVAVIPVKNNQHTVQPGKLMKSGGVLPQSTAMGLLLGKMTERIFGAPDFGRCKD